MAAPHRRRLAALVVVAAVIAVGCAPTPVPETTHSPLLGSAALEPVTADAGATYPSQVARASSITYVKTGNPNGNATVPAAAAEENVSNPTHVIGTGTPGSCTSAALASAVRGGGVITFNCGPSPVTIELTSTLTTCNTHNCKHPWQGGNVNNKLVVDGGGLVTLSGKGTHGIFYANACQESFGWLTSTCQTETRPLVVFQNITLERGNATSSPAGLENLRGGGAIAMRGGQFKAVNVTFRNNVCMTRDSDGGGGAVRLTHQTATSYIVNSTLENNSCANGGAISGLHASIHLINSMVTGNTATGTGANSGQGGNGGAIYGDGNTFHFTVDGTEISGNVAPEGGPGIFYVSNNRTGTLTIRDSTIINNTGERFHTAPYRDLFYLGKSLTITDSTVE